MFNLGLAGGLIINTAAAADWARFRGPDGSGIAESATPPTSWSDSDKLKWKTPLPGPGTSSPILVGDRIFITCWSGYADGSNGGPGNLKKHVVCLERETGKILWDSEVKGEPQVDNYQGFMQQHGYASQTPVSDGQSVFAYFGKAGAVAFDMNGKELWQVNLGRSANAKNWGSASSPILYKDYVIINASEESHAIYALDKKTGKEVWKAAGAALEYVFGTPVIMGPDDHKELVISLPNEVWALNPDTGKLRWYAQTGLPGNIAPSVVAGDGVVYAFGGFPKLGAVAIRTGGKGDVTRTHVLWSNNNSTYIPTPVLHEGRLYFVSDAGFATCLDAKTGQLVYKERVPGASARGQGKPFYASPVFANGNIYAVSRYGGTFVYPAKPEFKLLAHDTISSDNSQFNATPAVTGEQIFLRSDRYLYCFTD